MNWPQKVLDSLTLMQLHLFAHHLDIVFNLAKHQLGLSLIRVGMNSDHIPHEKLKSIPKALKEVNASYVTAHFGKWGIGSSPETLGYDFSDGPTKNKDGGFVNNKDQWLNEVMDDPKKSFL